MKLNKLLLAAAGIAAVLAPAVLRAETAFDTTSPYSAAVNLDFRIIIPGFLRLRVGTAGATVDQITFTVPAVNVGDSTPIAGTGGDAGAGSAANVSVQGNNGQVTITETNNSGTNGLGNGTPADGYINYNQISTTSSAPASLPAPTLSNAGGNTALPALTGTKITNQTAVWTFSYLNTTVPAAGTYGTSANGGRVTYTATMP
jgi:hypothetical protein